MELTKEYIAGFFDGEGCIGLYHRKGRVNGASLRIQLTQNKSKESTTILYYLKDKYGGAISEQRTLSNNVKYNWQLAPRGSKVFLEDIIEHLIIKKKQALLALYWLENRPTMKRGDRGRVVKFSKEDIEFNNLAIKTMKELKW